ncbi:DoxX subfamily [Flagellimonas sp. CMM7]|uniref:DoxX subfamily n=1 Tax=Flagellimonas sp. CMM7 TaxID=2654676 RepID=UPI0013D168A1|nr:DoxX subfamily [Flagellimonas sp. CMM7]UII79857.1 hypothetical protein LV704_19630 [Flagellimonas sp. CMM7]
MKSVFLEYRTKTYSKLQLIVLTGLRIAIGWHFLQEGLNKVYQPDWSAKTFLEASNNLCSFLFHYIAENEMLLEISDSVNQWGQVIIGVSLILGLLSKPLKYFGVLLLFLYYLCSFSLGTAHIINSIVIELLALCILILFPTSYKTGLDSFLIKHNR